MSSAAISSAGNRLGCNRAQLQSARLQSAQLQSDRLQSARLQSARLRSARLQSARLQSARLRSARLRSARLRSARLRSARLRSAQLRSVRLRSARQPSVWESPIVAPNRQRKPPPGKPLEPPSKKSRRPKVRARPPLTQETEQRNPSLVIDLPRRSSRPSRSNFHQSPGPDRQEIGWDLFREIPSNGTRWPPGTPKPREKALRTLPGLVRRPPKKAVCRWSRAGRDSSTPPCVWPRQADD
ncbi:MAG: pentapeptide repeat-containing protein [Akkermansiaceae bacterium]|nr:pentapeptide repeat-containing protein [Akkermansiaceae bacterium]